MRRGNGVPKTIEDLKRWYKEHHLPPEETTRFFIGKNIKEPKAFGIYQDADTHDFVVYKTKQTVREQNDIGAEMSHMQLMSSI